MNVNPGAKFCPNCAYDFTQEAAGASAAETGPTSACPNCGTRVAAGQRFCPNCATPMGAGPAVAPGVQPQYGAGGYGGQAYGGAGYGGPGYGYDVQPRPSRAPVIIASIIAAVLLIGGGVAAYFFLIKKDNSNSNSNSSVASSSGTTSDANQNTSGGVNIPTIRNANITPPTGLEFPRSPDTPTTTGGPASGSPGDVVKRVLFAMARGDTDEYVRNLVKKERDVVSLAREPLEKVISSVAEQWRAQGGLQSVDIVDEQIDGDTAVVTFRARLGNGTGDQGKLNLMKENGEWKYRSTNL